MESSAFIYNLTFTGTLVDARCPFSSPIRCIDGSCVDSYQGCLARVDKSSTAFKSPIAWGAPYATDVTDPCQVYCQDGSCRDRQENCPPILGCTDPLKPLKCRSGFCAQSADECATLYGTQVETETAGVPSATCAAEVGASTDQYFRCEDG